MLQRLFPILFCRLKVLASRGHRGGTGAGRRVLAHAKISVAQIIVCALLQLQIRGRQRFIELFRGFVELFALVRRGTGVEVQPRIVLFRFQHLLIILQCVLVAPVLIFPQGAPGTSEGRRRHD